jgi:hypothetical protein
MTTAPLLFSLLPAHVRYDVFSLYIWRGCNYVYKSDITHCDVSYVVTSMAWLLKSQVKFGNTKNVVKTDI